MDITRGNQVWCTDITYIRLSGCFVYLVDWFSRKVLSWEVSASMDDSFCVSALSHALRVHHNLFYQPLFPFMSLPKTTSSFVSSHIGCCAITLLNIRLCR
ncbi:DDE-type integrase/transposase/recombinase [Shewanella surugensis]|uniref:DDE-type integrase/transposase/recombinase n=1 Tax=Shewanella surugensis TaxID=212020 RepID=UPI0035D546AB